jgi:hypothetical protein
MINQARNNINDRKRCYYHKTFGKKAKKCKTVDGAPCDMTHLLKSAETISPPQNVSTASSNMRYRLTLSDRKTGATYLVDSGADVSCIRASAADRRNLPPSAPLIAANGSKIPTWGKRTTAVRLGSSSYLCSFHVAMVEQSLLGADFLAAHNLAVDLRGRRLLDLETFSTVAKAMPPSTLHDHKPRVGALTNPADHSPRKRTPSKRLLWPSKNNDIGNWRKTHDQSQSSTTQHQDHAPVHSRPPPTACYGTHRRANLGISATEDPVYVRRDGHRGPCHHRVTTWRSTVKRKPSPWT